MTAEENNEFEVVGNAILAFSIYGVISGFAIFFLIQHYLPINDYLCAAIAVCGGVLVGYLGSKFKYTRRAIAILLLLATGWI